MDMAMSDMGGTPSSTPLNDTGVDFSNETQALNFLQEILDDSELGIAGNAFARYFWYGVIVVIGIAAIANAVQTATLKMRIRAAAANRPHPARPESFFMKSIAAVTAVSREVSYPQVTPKGRTSWVKVPPLGTVLLLLTYLGFVLALEFIGNNIQGAQHYTALGIRAAWLAVAQVPLLILLAGKNNLIGLVTGVSYERLNVLHRWVSRVLLLLTTLHFGYQSVAWDRYGLMHLEWSTDTCPPTGIAAYAILLWLNLSTLAPIRNFSYEFFVVQHLITFFGFIIAVMLHLPTTALTSRIYIYIPIGLYLLDRLVRTCRLAYNNFRLGHVSLVAMDGGITRITVSNKQIKKWAPGSHVLLSIPKLGLGQSHPATIVSVPSSHNQDLVFILKSHNGWTNRIHKAAAFPAPSSASHESDASKDKHVALIDGPYGGCHADFAAFDTVVLISGSTGVTFTVPLFLDIAHRSSSQKLPVRRVEFLWVVKNTSWTHWISDELQSAFSAVRDAGIEVAIKVFVTCDDAFIKEESSDEKKMPGCPCTNSVGPCCCVNIDDSDNDDDSIRPAASERPTMDAGALEKNQTALEVTRPTTASALKSPTTTTREMSRNNISWMTFLSGRPDFDQILWDLADQAEGEMGVAVCGPLGLNTNVRMNVAKISDERAVNKGTGAQGIYLHAEGFGW